MKINKKQIRSVRKYLADIAEQDTFLIGVRFNEDRQKVIEESFDYLDVQHVIFIPSPFLGIMSQRNTVGEEIPDKTQPKETAYRAQYWELKGYDGVWRSGTSEVPYQRFPRKFVGPKKMRFRYLNDVGNGREKLIIIDRHFVNSTDNDEEIKFAINLLLEIFSEAETLTFDPLTSRVVPIETVEWQILPKGERIWESFQRGKSYQHTTKSEKTLIQRRLKKIESFSPDRIFQGIGGYTGYLVFEFKDKQLFIFDSIVYGNATYIFAGEWKNVSKLTKKEIIQNHLAKDRLVHMLGWETQISKYLSKSGGTTK
ncbi:hypothetical protein DSM07_03360 [Oenococcus sp. UCMA 16435]|nr:hypothetical protein DSM07_03360 [Oenococcus sp. UCMA 16435]MDN6967810.1 hypothetical protein [Oenococcus sp. UCMA 17063]